VEIPAGGKIFGPSIAIFCATKRRFAVYKRAGFGFHKSFFEKERCQMRSRLVLAVFGLLLGKLALAGPLDPAHVAADAQWLVHADADAMRQSGVLAKAFQVFIERNPGIKIFVAGLDKSREIIGMDPRKDLHGITAYGKKLGQEEGVLILVADVDQKLLQQIVKQALDYRAVSHGPYEIHCWTHRDNRGRRPVAGAFYKPNVLVFSGSPEEVKAALDVLDGKAARLEASSPLAASAPAGTMLLGRATGIDKAKLPGDPPFAKQLRDLHLVFGESKGKIVFQGKLTLNSAEAANLVRDVLQGLRALALLAAGDDAATKALAGAFRVSAEAQSVDFEVPIEALWEHVQKDRK
jgi:hypothetical protein